MCGLIHISNFESVEFEKVQSNQICVDNLSSLPDCNMQSDHHRQVQVHGQQ